MPRQKYQYREVFPETLKSWRRSGSQPAKELPITLFDVIAKHKLAEMTLHESEGSLKPAPREANDGLWYWDLKNDELCFSPGWKSMLGYTDVELENRYDCFEQLLHPEDYKPTLALLHDFLKGRGARFEAEFRMRHKDGHYVDILSRALLLHDDQRDVTRLVGTHLNITEQKRQDMQNRQARKMEALGQLAGGVAHDFKNILSIIFGYSQLILEKLEANDPVKIYADQIVLASKRAAVLTESLLSFSRKQAATLTVVELSKVIREFESFLLRLIREDIELEINCAEEPLHVRADRGQMEQVIMNLVANSRDSMPNGGKLLIEARPITMSQENIANLGYGKAGEYALFSVSDSGSGMDKETRSRIFEPFFTTKEPGNGTGLGLSMAYEIVKKHDGFINVCSEPGKGTIFEIYLPRVLTAAIADKEGREDSVALLGGTETVLVGEDDPDLLRLTANVFSRFGYHVIEAVDGQDAVEKFVEHKEEVDLVIVDSIMPKKNGKVACDEMRMLSPGLKTILVSGYTRDILEAGNTFDVNTVFMHKPFSSNDLLFKAREMLR